MTQAIKTAAAIAATAAIAAGFFYALSQGVSKSERAECLKWQSEARQFVGYYLTSWQAAQCAAHGVAIDAPILK